MSRTTQLRELSLILRVDRKRKKKRAGDIRKGTQDVEFEPDLISWFRPRVRKNGTLCHC